MCVPGGMQRSKRRERRGETSAPTPRPYPKPGLPDFGCLIELVEVGNIRLRLRGSGVRGFYDERGVPRAPSPALASPRSTSQSKSDVSDFDQLIRAQNRVNPILGCTRGEVTAARARMLLPSLSRCLRSSCAGLTRASIIFVRWIILSDG